MFFHLSAFFWKKPANVTPSKRAKKVFIRVLGFFSSFENLIQKIFWTPFAKSKARRKAKEGKKTKQGAERLSLGSPYSPKAGSDESCANNAALEQEKQHAATAPDSFNLLKNAHCLYRRETRWLWNSFEILTLILEELCCPLFLL